MSDVEGEFKKRIATNRKRLLLPEEVVFSRYILDIELQKWLDEARKDIMPDWYWFKWAKMSQEHDEQLTKDYKNLLLKLLKWFGPENGHTQTS